MSTKVKGGAIKESSIPFNALSKEVKDKINSSTIKKYLIVESPGSGIQPTFTKIDDSSIKCEIFGNMFGGLIQEVNYFTGCVLIDCINDGFIKLDIGDSLNGYEEEVFILKENNGTELIFDYVDGDDIDSAITKLSTYRFYAWEQGYMPAMIPQSLINMPYIDPVVWKYMCNPLIIQNGENVPEELIGEYSDDVGYKGGYFLKYPNLAMYKIMITSNRIDKEYGDGASVIITPSNINEYGLGIHDIYISKDYGVYTGGANIDENKNWEIQ